MVEKINSEFRKVSLDNGSISELVQFSWQKDGGAADMTALKTWIFTVVGDVIIHLNEVFPRWGYDSFQLHSPKLSNTLSNVDNMPWMGEGLGYRKIWGICLKENPMNKINVIISCKRSNTFHEKPPGQVNSLDDLTQVISSCIGHQSCDTNLATCILV